MELHLAFWCFGCALWKLEEAELPSKTAQNGPFSMLRPSLGPPWVYPGRLPCVATPACCGSARHVRATCATRRFLKGRKYISSSFKKRRVGRVAASVCIGKIGIWGTLGATCCYKKRRVAQVVAARAFRRHFLLKFMCKLAVAGGFRAFYDADWCSRSAVGPRPWPNDPARCAIANACPHVCVSTAAARMHFRSPFGSRT